MKKQRGFVVGIEAWAIGALLLAGAAHFNVGDAVEGLYQTGCEAAGYEWSSDPVIGCSGLPRRDK